MIMNYNIESNTSLKNTLRGGIVVGENTDASGGKEWERPGTWY